MTIDLKHGLTNKAFDMKKPFNVEEVSPDYQEI